MDIMTPEKRSALMSRIKGKGTTPELYIEWLMSAGGLHFDQHDSSLPGKPDFVFREDRVAVFIDGDFWHGWRFPVWQHKLSEEWQQKISANRMRDGRNHRKLRRCGWNVLRIWEHQVESDPIGCVQRIASVLNSQIVDVESVRECYAELPKLKRRPRLPKP